MRSRNDDPIKPRPPVYAAEGMNPRLRKVILVWLWMLSVIGGVSAEDVSQDRLVSHVWQRENGLPQNRVTAVTQTRDGYIWVGTYNGLARFNGEQFVCFNADNTPGMASSRVTSLFEAKDGALWIGHEGGEVTCYQNGEFKPVIVKAQWRYVRIAAFGSDEAGDIWLLNNDGLLSRLRDGLVLDPPKGNLSKWADIAVSRQGIIWVLRDGKVSVLRHERLQPLTFEIGANNTLVLGITASHDGGFWLAADDRVQKLRGDAVEGDRSLGTFAGTPCNLVEIKHDVLAAITTDKGFELVFPNEKIQVYNHHNGFPSDWITAFHEDREGGLWVGSGGGGLELVRESCLHNISPPDEWKGRAVLSVYGDAAGALWVGTEGGGLYRFRNGSWTNFATSSGLVNSYIWSIAEDSASNFWVGTWNGGLFERHGERFDPAPELEQVTEPITALLPARQGGLWIGTGAGLLRYEASEKNYWCDGRGNEPANHDVRCIVENTNGIVWYGTMGKGLFRLQNGSLTRYRKSDGLPSDYIECLHQDASGALWIGSVGGGLGRFKAGRFAIIGEKQGLSDNVICDIEDDGQGFYWLSSYGGIIRVEKKALDLCADGVTSSVDSLNFGMSDGMPTLECSGGGCRTADGSLWFPTSRGLVMVRPEDAKINRWPPPVVIEKLLIDGQNVALEYAGAALKIPPGRHRLEFQYAGLSFAAPEKVRFRHRLDGLDTDWVEVGTKSAADYNYLPPGTYTFHVLASNNDGVWNETGVSLKFTLLPHFWQTAWFRALSITALILLTGGAVWVGTRRRLRAKLERVERQRALERERSRIAKDIHDDLGSSLTRINLMSQSARLGMHDVPQTLKNLDQICTTARQLTRAMDEIVWAVDPQHDTLDSLASYLSKLIHELLGDSGIRCRLDFPVYLPAWPITAETRHNLFLACKEALNNVLKYSAATEVQVSFTLAPGEIVVKIHDNGRGFDPTVKDGRLHSRRNGLVNMRQRLQEIGGRCEIESQPGQGTKVSFYFPGRPATKVRRY